LSTDEYQGHIGPLDTDMDMEVYGKQKQARGWNSLRELIMPIKLE